MKWVVVSGATKGIGLATTRLLLDKNYGVIGLSRSLTVDYSTLMEKYPDQTLHYCVDLSDPTATAEMGRSIIKKHGAIYALINNAAQAGDGALANMHASNIRGILDTNLLGAITLTKYILRSMLLNKEGRIVSISSTAAVTGYSGLSVYSATKAGLEGFSRSLSREVGKHNITVNCVSPGYVETDMSADLQGEKLASIKRRSPLGVALPEDIANAVLFLLSDGAVKITGTVIRVDGGGAA